MAAIKINDLRTSQVLERKAMASIKGGGAPWVYGWISPFIPASARLGPSLNFIQVTNNFFAEQMNNQFQSIDIKNFADNSNIALSANQAAANFAQ